MSRFINIGIVVVVFGGLLYIMGTALAENHADVERQQKAFAEQNKAILEASKVASVDELRTPANVYATAQPLSLDTLRLGYALIHVVPTSRTASHGHKLDITYYGTLDLCEQHRTMLQSMGANCLPTIIPPT